VLRTLLGQIELRTLLGQIEGMGPGTKLREK
jgi:hypothetical protein